jgi:hypothetical protein
MRMDSATTWCHTICRPVWYRNEQDHAECRPVWYRTEQDHTECRPVWYRNEQEVLERPNPPTFLTLLNNVVLYSNYLVKKMKEHTDRQKVKYFTKI